MTEFCPYLKRAAQPALQSYFAALRLSYLSWLTATWLLSFIPGSASAADPLLYHNIHNWSRNDERADYHALAMSYGAVSRDYRNPQGKPPDAIFDELGVIKPVTAEHVPVAYDLKAGRIRYLDYTADDKQMTMMRLGRIAQQWYTLDRTDLQLLSKFGCSKVSSNPVLPIGSTDNTFKNTFYVEGPLGAGGNWPVANLQSRWVVNQLVNLYLGSVRAMPFVGLMWDDLRADYLQGCANKNANGGGFYSSWKAGQKDLVKRVTDALHKQYTSAGFPYFVTGNPWIMGDKAVATTWGAWYADGSLRLDQYYFEHGLAGGISEVASGRDPSTGLPAFTYSGNGVPANYLPADRVALNVDYTTYGATPQDFLLSNLRVAGTAGVQGSWFGYYGRMTLDAQRSPGVYVFTNADQLTRAIPNFDNLAGIPLSARAFDSTTYTYSSTNSFSSARILYTRNPINREVYAVYRDVSSSLRLRSDELIDTAYFVDDLFNKTDADARRCLARSGANVVLTCSDRIGQGIRIKLR